MWQWLTRLGKYLFPAISPPSEPNSPAPERKRINRSLLVDKSEKSFPVKVPELPAGVVPKDKKPAIAMDSTISLLQWAGSCAGAIGFPGYPYLADLATRSEYRAMVTSLSTEMTREWIELTSSETAGEGTKAKITLLNQEMEKLGIKSIIQKFFDHDGYFGRGQIFIDLQGHKADDPLILSPKTIEKGTKVKFVNIEPMWTTPVAYNAIDPTAPDFYKPNEWWVLGKPVKAQRILMVTTREVPDMLKPAFNFSGISLSQLAEPYVNNWLRTRQSVSDLLSNFSITALKTRMETVLAGQNDGADVIERAQLFTATRSNQGLMLLDFTTEDLVQINTPLGGLHELQAQAQEQMCAVSKIPAVVLTGISPSGFGNLAEGEMTAFRDWIAALQEAYARKPIHTIITILQLCLFGAIDPEIGFEFNPLEQMSDKELAEIRKANADTAGLYIDKAVIDASEERERIARDPNTAYHGLDLTKEIVPPNNGLDMDDDDPDDMGDDNNPNPFPKGKTK